jgi:sugar phosphate isomerase/epimerase
LATDYATGSAGPTRRLAPTNSGWRILEMIMGQISVHETNLRFATRLNSFGSRPDAYWPKGHVKPSPLELAERASKAEGLTDVDLNYPDHVGPDPRVTGEQIRELGLAVNGIAMRYYSNPAFKIGAFTNPDPAVRREAIDLTKRGIDAARQAGCNLMTLWLGQDGFDYAFQADYARLWADEIQGIREVALHDPDCLVSIEYKPNEPRSYSLMPDCATTLLALKEVDLPNVGVTLDFAHVLYADEQPAFAAALINRHSRLLGMHLNDGYSKRDDGLMVGAVHSLQTIELLRQVKAAGFAGPIYFDTFPDLTGLDPIKECEANIATVKSMLRVIDRLDADNELQGAIALQDAVATQAIVRKAMFGS